MTCFAPAKRSLQYIHPLEDVFAQFFNDSHAVSLGAKVAPIEVRVDEKNVYLTIEVPGIERDAISIEYRDNLVTISGEKKADATDSTQGVYQREISYGKFSRSVKVGDVAFDQAEAKLENGVLKVSIPKAQIAESKRLTIL